MADNVVVLRDSGVDSYSDLEDIVILKYSGKGSGDQEVLDWFNESSEEKFSLKDINEMEEYSWKVLPII